MKIEKIKIIPQCEGCNRVLEDQTCNAYSDPQKQWRLHECLLASHIEHKFNDVKGQEKVRVGQQKQKKSK